MKKTHQIWVRKSIPQVPIFLFQEKIIFCFIFYRNILSIVYRLLVSVSANMGKFISVFYWYWLISQKARKPKGPNTQRPECLKAQRLKSPKAWKPKGPNTQRPECLKSQKPKGLKAWKLKRLKTQKSDDLKTQRPKCPKAWRPKSLKTQRPKRT